MRAEQRAKAASTDIAEATGGTVTFRQSDKSTKFQPDETVLEASERVGINIDYSCRVGMCGVCVVKILAGKVAMEVEDGFDPDDKAAGIVLACQAKSTGDVAVDSMKDREPLIVGGLVTLMLLLWPAFSSIIPRPCEQPAGCRARIGRRVPDAFPPLLPVIKRVPSLK